MVLGIYALTYQSVNNALPMGRFASINDVIHQVEINNLTVTDLVTVKHAGSYVTTTAGRVIFNSILPEQLQFTEMTNTKITTK